MKSNKETMRIFAELPKDTNMSYLWKVIGGYRRVSFATNSEYEIVKFEGDIDEGQDVLSILEQYTNREIRVAYR